MPFAVFWMRAHFVNMPQELSEAARVDGAAMLGPLLADPRAARQAGHRRRSAILLSVWTWNQFLLALVLVEDPNERTMAGALGAFQGQ